MKKAFNFFSSNCENIDIVRDDKIELVFFIKLPYCHWLPDEKKKSFNEEVDRSSTKSKVTALVKESDNIIEIIKHEERL